MSNGYGNDKVSFRHVEKTYENCHKLAAFGRRPHDGNFEHVAMQDLALFRRLNYFIA